jgi:endo-1,4-beta-xylanase
MNIKVKLRILPAMLVLLLAFAVHVSVIGQTESTLKGALAGKFYMGAALNTGQINGTDVPSLNIVSKHFNSIVAENCMKSAVIQPVEGEFNFVLSDKFVEFGVKNNMHIIGHTLIWHSQAPKWFFTNEQGSDVSREVLIERMRNHINGVVGRYKGRVHGWDVVNEAIEDDGSWRKSKFYEIIGEEYVELAFKFASEADPDAALYYNDYSMANERRRNAVISMVKNLQAKGIKIDGIGMQGHLSMKYPPIDEYEKSIIAFSDLGLTVMITELDLTALPGTNRNFGADVGTRTEYEARINPYTGGLPDQVAQEWNNRCADFFKLFLKHRDKISRVTTWGVTDNHSWKNNWPVRGRTDYPLLFDRNYQPKTVVEEIIRAAEGLN